MTSVAHLARRFATSLSRREPSAADAAWALGMLLPGEAALWQRMSVQDRRHAITVARRFVALAPGCPRGEVAGALLHDIGKLASGLGTFGRVLATIVGPRTARLRRYREHEQLGEEMLRAAGSATETVDLVAGRGSSVSALRRADDL